MIVKLASLAGNMENAIFLHMKLIPAWFRFWYENSVDSRRISDIALLFAYSLDALGTTRLQLPAAVVGIFVVRMSFLSGHRPRVLQRQR